MSSQNPPRAAKFLRALSGIVAHTVEAAQPDALIGAVLEACVRPGGAAAAALVMPGQRHTRVWLRRPGIQGVSREDHAMEWPRLPTRTRGGGTARLVDVDLAGRWLGLQLSGEVYGVEVTLRFRPGPRTSLLMFFHGQVDRLPEEERDFAQSVADLLAVGLERLRALRRLEFVAVRDDLTQAFNFRFLKTALKKELARATRAGGPLSVLMVDVDLLKQYNDRFGHVMGSALLRDLSRILSRELRGVDWIAKYGGDEFLVVLPGTDKHGASILAERLRRAVESHGFDRALAGEVTIAMGVASFPEDGAWPLTLIEAADRALYRAKGAGRNLVYLAGEGTLRRAA